MRFLLFFLAFLVVVVLGKERNIQNEQKHSIGSHYHPIAYGKRSVSVTAPASDIAALEKLYSELDGNKWTNNRGWLIGNPCDSWYGIVCNVNTSRVSAILLAENNLRGTIPIELSALTGLEVLDLSVNYLSSSIPRGLFSPLTLFRELYLDTNELSGSLEFFDDLPVSMEIIYLPNNKFSGEIPATIGKFTSVFNFQVFSNELSGTIPPTVGLMSSLESLDFGFNSLTGTLPMEIGNLQNLENFWIYDDKISGPLPEYWGNMKKLKLFEITRNEISGTIPDSWANMESLEIFRVGGNQMGGTPNQICNMLNLTEVSLYSNGFTGIPTCGSNSQMRIFYMNNNQISGEIPDGIGQLTSLQRIDFSHNQISGTVPQSFENLDELIFLDLSHNNFETTLDLLLLPTTRLRRFTVCDLSHNLIYGDIPIALVWNADTQEELSQSITYLYLNDNHLSGTIPDNLSWMYQLTLLDISNNNLTGAIPESLSYLRTLHIDGNEMMFGVNGGHLPSFLKLDNSSIMKFEDGGYSCPSLSGINDEYNVQLDPKYYNYTYCTCEKSYRGINGSCSLCPAHTSCPGGGVTIIVESGYYPYPDKYNPEYLVSCVGDNFGFTPCNPNNRYPFECKKGYEGRLCSKCSDNYFARGIECLECLSLGPQIVVIILVVSVVVLGYLFFLLTRPKVSLPSAARKTAIFYFQALNLLLTRFAGWPRVFSFLSTVSSVFNFGFNYTCIIFDYYDIYYVTLAIPFFAVAFNALVLLGVYFAKFAYGAQVSWARWVNGAIRTILLTLNFMYLPLCTVILSMFVCVEDSYTHSKYLAVAPYNRCSDEPAYTAAVTVGALFFILYVIGIPALFACILFKYRKVLEEHKILASIGSLYVDFTERSYYYELAGLLRRFLFALVITVIQQDNLFLMSAILF